MNIIILIKILIIITIACGLAVWYFTYLWKETNKIFDKLDKVKTLAKKAFTIKELNMAWYKLQEVRKECWNQYQLADIKEIKAIIETKYEMLCQNKK